MENYKTSFSNEGNYGNKTKLVKNEEIIDDNTKVAEELHILKTVVASLNIHRNLYTVKNVGNMSDTVDKAKKKKKSYFIQAFCLPK